MAGLFPCLACTLYVLYIFAVIRSFADRATADFARTGRTKLDWESAAATAKRKIDALRAAVRLEDLRVPPGDRLEQLTGDRAAQYSIRMNDQWRVCFRWTEHGAEDVQIRDCL